jgi:hypothetical protein
MSSDLPVRPAVIRQYRVCQIRSLITHAVQLTPVMRGRRWAPPGTHFTRLRETRRRDSSDFTRGSLKAHHARKLLAMAVVALALVVAIIGAATGLGSLLWQFTTWKRSGWDLDVIAYWDTRRQKIIVEITNTGRQECVISEVRYFLDRVIGKVVV